MQMAAKIPMDFPFAVDLLCFSQEDIIFNKKGSKVYRFASLLTAWRATGPQSNITSTIPSHYANLLAFLKKKTKQVLEEERGGGQGEGKENRVSCLEELSTLSCSDKMPWPRQLVEEFIWLRGIIVYDGERR